METESLIMSCKDYLVFEVGLLRVFVSAPRQKRFFIDCVKEVVDERSDRWFYPPDEFRDLDDKQILDKVKRELRDSNLVLMDVSMKSCDDESYPNSGVMIEFGLVVNDPRKGIDFAYFFCDETTERNDLPPMIPRVDVEQYSEDEENRENFKKIIRQALEDFERKAPDKLQKALGAQFALQMLYESTVYTNPKS